MIRTMTAMTNAAMAIMRVDMECLLDVDGAPGQPFPLGGLVTRE
jgi:hypothetical protein